MNCSFYASNEYTSEAIARNETLFTVANGKIGFRGDFEEKKGTKHKGTYVNGFFDSEPIAYGESAYGYAENHETILNLPDPKRIELEIDGHAFSVDDGIVSGFEMKLDFAAGIMSRRLLWTSPAGARVDLLARRLVSFARENGAAIEYSVTACDRPVSVRLSSSVDTTAHNLDAEDDPRIGSKFSSRPLIVRSLKSDGSGIAFSADTRNSGLTVSGAVLHELSGVDPDTARNSFASENGVASAVWEFELAAGGTASLVKYVSYATGKTSVSRDLADRAFQCASALRSSGFDVLCAEQKAFLESFWDTAAVSIDGDEENNLALHFNLFHLLQSAGRDGATSIAAKGLTAEGYEGHYFWDTESYVCPVFTYLAPEVAGRLLEYRYSILPAARRRAAVMSLKGALYPWRTIDGEETSAYYPAGTAQYHINADIMFALRKYLAAAGTASFDRAKALEMGIETARMWMSLGSFIPSKGNAFCVNEVTGPDEYTACVNNNAYTNLLARENLRMSVSLVESFGAKCEGVEPVSASELASWKEAADRMYVPYDAKTGIYPQDDSFLDKAEWDFANTPPGNYPLLLHYHPLVIYRHRVLKQPDLVLAQFLLSGEFSLAEKIRNFKFYEPLTTGDSSLSHCIQSIMACEIGDTDKAMAYFNKTARMDIADVHGNTCDGIHTAAMAGSWMSVVYGFAGFRDFGGKWSFNPRLPEGWKGLSFSLKLSGSVLDVQLGRSTAAYSLRRGDILALRHRNEEFTLTRGERKEFSLSPRLRAVLFDLDGVITDTAELHYKAWKHIATQCGLEFDRDVNERLRGVSRDESFEIILSHNGRTLSDDEKQKRIAEKNAFYVSLLGTLGQNDVLPGIKPLLDSLRERGIKIVLASASRNAPLVLRRLALADAFDAVADVDGVRMSKPEPDIFLRGAELASAWPTDCVGVEDAQAGIEAIRKAGMKAVAVGDSLVGADAKVSGTAELSLSLLESCFRF